MSSMSKKALISAASIGMVLTSSLLAEKQDSSAPEKVTKIAAPIDVDEDVFYSALHDDVLEKVARPGGASYTFYCNKGQPVKKPPSSSSKKPKQ